MNHSHRSNPCHATAAAGCAPFAPRLLALSLMLSFAASGHAAPAGGVVAAGGASIASSGANTTITQTTQNAVVNWQSFGIAAGETVQFVQPNKSSVALNRVIGSDPSAIFGKLSSNGKVFLLNPNGILFGSGANVNVGGLVASTLGMTDANFMAGQYKFSGAGSGAVVNQGTITADGGYVALLANNVSNQGVISARLGTVALAAGNAMTLDVAGDSLINVKVDEGAVNALVQNGGMLRADGGLVLMTTQAAGNLLSTAVNNTGVVQAQTLSSSNGKILLLADMQSGTVSAGGTLDASAPNGGNGGFIETSAARVRIQDNVRITSAAPQGLAGTWLIDPVDFTIAAATGDMTGTQLSTALVGGNVTIMSSAGAAGVRGDVNVSDAVGWSANRLTLNAQNNINIDAPMNGSGTASLSLQYGQQAVATGNLSTYNVLAPVNLPAGNNFTTQLGSNGVPTNYVVITSLGAQGSTTATDLQGMRGNLATHYALGSNIDASPTALWNAGAGFDPVGTLIPAASFTGNFDGLGHTISNLTINRPLADNVGLFGYVLSTGGAMLRNVKLNGAATITGGSYVGNLVGHITGDIVNSQAAQAVATSVGGGYVGGLAGWSTGNITNSSATGAVNGGTTGYAGGLVGWITGNIVCCFATGAVNSTGLEVGGLVGWITGSISRSYATGRVHGDGLDVGGLAGQVLGATSVTSNSYATGNVSSNGINVGGLIGQNFGTVTNTYAAGSVTGNAPIGGLIGINNGGTISTSFWDRTKAGALTAGQGVVTGAVGMATPDMQQQVNFMSATPANQNMSPAPNWDFGSIWTMNGVNYPSLQSCLKPATWVAVAVAAPPPPPPPPPP
ncbi:MAG: hypothetical protein JWQ13_846, partial [Ramlibacter sp.]|nr:hypothetical protein [Ramlibacter sp.]